MMSLSISLLILTLCALTMLSALLYKHIKAELVAKSHATRRMKVLERRLTRIQGELVSLRDPDLVAALGTFRDAVLHAQRKPRWARPRKILCHLKQADVAARKLAAIPQSAQAKREYTEYLQQITRKLPNVPNCDSPQTGNSTTVSP